MKSCVAYKLHPPVLNAGTKSLQLDVYDIIGDFWGEGVSAKAVASQLKQNQDASEIRVRINSLGGILDDGNAIRTLLREHPATVTVDVDGVAASAATIIMAAGDKVRIGRGNAIMIHEATNGGARLEGEHLATAEALKVYNNGIAETYAAMAASRGKPTTKEQFRALMAQEKWFSAQEAVDIGLADEVTEIMTGAVAACLDLTQCKAIPGWVASKFTNLEMPDMRTNTTASATAIAAAVSPKPTEQQSSVSVPTNDPPAPKAPEANCSKEKTMKFALIAAALGLPEGAPDTEVLASVSQLNASKDERNKLLGLVGAKSTDEAVGTIAALQANRDQNDGEGYSKIMTALSANSSAEALGTIAALQGAKERLQVAEAKLADQEAKREQSERAEIIGKLEAEGKCTPSQKETLFPTLNIDGLKAFAATAVPIMNKGKGRREVTAAKKWEDMTAAEQRALHESDPEAYTAAYNAYNSGAKSA